MKRLWFAAILTILIIAITATGIVCLKKYSKSVDDELNLALAAVNIGDMKTALRYCKSTENEWVKAEKVLKWFINANDVGQIGVNIAMLPPLAKNDEPAELASQIMAIKVQLMHISHMESVYS